MLKKFGYGFLGLIVIVCSLVSGTQVALATNSGKATDPAWPESSPIVLRFYWPVVVSGGLSCQQDGLVYNTTLSDYERSLVRPLAEHFAATMKRLTDCEIDIVIDWLELSASLADRSYTGKVWSPDLDDFAIAYPDLPAVAQVEISRAQQEGRPYAHTFLIANLGPDGGYAGFNRSNQNFSGLNLGMYGEAIVNGRRQAVSFFDGQVVKYPEEILIHELLHGLTHYHHLPIPDSHDGPLYGYIPSPGAEHVGPTFGFMKFFADVFTGQVVQPSGQKTGMTPTSWRAFASQDGQSYLEDGSQPVLEPVRPDQLPKITDYDPWPDGQPYFFCEWESNQADRPTPESYHIDPLELLPIEEMIYDGCQAGGSGGWLLGLVVIFFRKSRQIWELAETGPARRAGPTTCGIIQTRK